MAVYYMRDGAALAFENVMLKVGRHGSKREGAGEQEE
jgi:hypothetical protein